MSQSRHDILAEFRDWAKTYITGDEKGQAQLFLDRLFKAFGQKGSLEVGGSPEMRIKKAQEDGGGTSFADYVWKPIVLIEMKKRGVDLRKHYRQAFEYWTRLVPNRPRYVVLCNFDAFHIYDFDRQVDDPVDIVTLDELPDRWGPLAFLYRTNEAPHFGNDREKVTREAANRLAECYNKLETRKVDAGLRQRFILQCLVALFAEDIGLLERYTFATLLDDCKQPADSYDLVGGLFEAMNRPGGNSGGRYKGVRYFNGGIFAQPARVELYTDELNQLREAAKSDWSKVSPEIFGTLFEHSMESGARHAFGAHYTSQIDILKIVNPTIVEPWTAAIESARTGRALLELLARLGNLRVLDPACGSGNFLYIAYRRMKELESRIRDRVRAEFPNEQPTLAHVNARQFFGMDINPFAIELAKVTMMLGRKLAIDELHIADEADLPLDNLDANFQCVDALITRTPEGGAIQTPWPPADVIIGNPPFLGAKRLKPKHGADYVNAVRKLYPQVPGMADYCVYWIRRAADHLPECTKADRFAGRAGLVGTQNIRNNQSRVGGLDHVVATGTIVDAVDNQPWSGEANVHVSIANWIKTQDMAVVPKNKRLWTKTQQRMGANHTIVRGVRQDKAAELRESLALYLNSALSDGAIVSSAEVLKCNVIQQSSFQGVVPGYDGFAISPQDARLLITQQAISSEIIKPWMIGRDALTGDGTPTRYIIDFADRNMFEAQKYVAAFAHLRKHILTNVENTARTANHTMKAARVEHLQRWWQFWNVRTDMRAAFANIRRFLACSRVTKRPIFVFATTAIIPDGALQVWALDDDYSFGIIQSRAHAEWFFANCSKLKSDYRYTRRSVWDTFPWPQNPSDIQVKAVASAAQDVRRVRAELLETTDGGLRAMYRRIELPGKHPLKDAHAALDNAVNTAYGFAEGTNLLENLLKLNQKIARNETNASKAMGPGIPATFNDHSQLITTDCVQAVGLIDAFPKEK